MSRYIRFTKLKHLIFLNGGNLASVRNIARAPHRRCLYCTVPAGKYPVIPQFKYSYDTSLQNSNFQVSKKFRKNISVFIRLVFTIPKLFRTKFEMHMEKQKRQIDIWIVPFILLSFCDTILVRFLFFVSLWLFWIWFSKFEIL
jgi:hypothetical protein